MIDIRPWIQSEANLYFGPRYLDPSTCDRADLLAWALLTAKQPLPRCLRWLETSDPIEASKAVYRLASAISHLHLAQAHCTFDELAVMAAEIRAELSV